MYLFLCWRKSLQLLKMSCCRDAGEGQLVPRNKFKENKEPQPVKFRMLSFLGLREYLIDKYVFSRSEPKYKIYNEGGKLNIRTQFQIAVPVQYEQQVNYIHDQKHSVFAVSLNLKDRSLYQGTVIYSHGNCSDLSHSLNFISRFAAWFPKLDYVVYDYTGYGSSTSKTVSEDSICEDLQLLIDNIVAKPEQIILWGFSLGAYPTAKVASRHKFKGVILQSPMASVYSLFADKLTPYSTFTNDCFSILQSIGQIKSFLVLMHSKQDEIIPFEHSHTLFERYRMVSSNPYCFLVQITALKHNHMHAFMSSPQTNKIRQTVHNYLNLMLEAPNLPKGRQFQLQKQIYLKDIPKYAQVQKIDVDNRQIQQDPSELVRQLKESINFTNVKSSVDFELDDIENEEVIGSSCVKDGNLNSHLSYFKVSQEAKDESEASQIQGQKRIASLKV